MSLKSRIEKLERATSKEVGIYMLTYHKTVIDDQPYLFALGNPDGSYFERREAEEHDEFMKRASKELAELAGVRSAIILPEDAHKV